MKGGDDFGARYLPAIKWLELFVWASLDCDASRRGAYLRSLDTHRPQSSSASRFTAGALGFLTFSQRGERPRR